MNINLTKITVKYQDKIKNEFDVYYILIALEDEETRTYQNAFGNK